MSRLRRRVHSDPQAIDLAPVVDVALILIVFLLLTTRLVDHPSLPVQLPLAENGSQTKPGERLTLTILAAGMVYHGDRLLDSDAAISAAVQGAPHVVLHVDRDCPHGDYLRVVDLLIGAGVPRIDEATESKDALDEW